MSTSRTFMPGLVREACVAGSWHTAGTPDRIRSEVDGTTVDFAWRAVGSSVYNVTAKGAVKVTGMTSDGLPIFDYESFSVRCSCPDGERQHASSQATQRLYVCKHAKSSLDSVLDPSAIAELTIKAEEAAAKAKAEAERRATCEKEQRTLQDRDMPGERERIEYGLSKRSDAAIVSMIKEATKTAEGLEALTKVFPKEVMPPKKAVKCGRCGKEYDPQVASDTVCREEHPYDRSRTMWDTSKKSWEHCRRCNKDFNLDGFHSWGKRKRDDPEDEGPYCYETTHVPEDEYDADNDPIMENLDNSDY